MVTAAAGMTWPRTASAKQSQKLLDFSRVLVISEDSMNGLLLVLYCATVVLLYSTTVT